MYAGSFGMPGMFERGKKNLKGGKEDAMASGLRLTERRDRRSSTSVQTHANVANKK